MKFVNSKKKLTEEKLTQFEKRLGVVLPSDYRAFLLEQNGGEPDPPMAFSFRDEDGDEGEAVVTCFSPVGGMDGNLEEVAERLREIGLPGRLVPIASVDDEDELLLSASGEDRGKVYLWYLIEGGFDGEHLLPVANSFEDFLKQLRPSEE